jgi:hypothetical protein
MSLSIATTEVVVDRYITIGHMCQKDKSSASATFPSSIKIQSPASYQASKLASCLFLQLRSINLISGNIDALVSDVGLCHRENNFRYRIRSHFCEV